MNSITFHYDIVSPYSWLAFETLCRYKNEWNLDLIFKPVFLGGLFQASGNQSPAFLPARAAYMLKDFERNAAYFQVPLKFPPNFPANTLKAVRFLTALSHRAPEHMEELSRALWVSYWGDGKDISTLETITEACRESTLDLEIAEECLGLIEDPAIKEAVKAETATLAEKGAFGLPTFFVHTPNGEEMFFGSDRFPIVANLLGVDWKGPVLD